MGPISPTRAQAEGTELPSSGSSNPSPSPFKGTTGASNLERHPDAKVETSSFVRCMTHIKDKIVSFFKCIFCCGRTATKEELKAAIDEIEQAGDKTMQAFHAKLDPLKIPSYQDSDALFLLAAFIEGFSLVTQAKDIFEAMREANKADKPKIGSSKLKADKKKALELFKLCDQVKVAKESTPGLQKKVEDFSLEKMQIAKELSSSASILYAVELLGEVHWGLPAGILKVVNGIRQKNGMQDVIVPTA